MLITKIIMGISLVIYLIARFNIKKNNSLTPLAEKAFIPSLIVLGTCLGWLYYNDEWNGF